jgi:hypothetical protein
VSSGARGARLAARPLEWRRPAVPRRSGGPPGRGSSRTTRPSAATRPRPPWRRRTGRRQRPVRSESGPKNQAKCRTGPNNQANKPGSSQAKQPRSYLLGAGSERGRNRNIWWFSGGCALDVVMWLARKDSNLRSPDPESGDRFSRFLARREHETHRFLPQILPSLVTCRKRGQVATSGSPDSLAPRHRPNRSVARGFVPPGPTPWIVLPDWIANALREAA